ncbi:hypothetical protein RJI07_03520 [Mycoplasmatota bacterium WC30]
MKKVLIVLSICFTMVLMVSCNRQLTEFEKALAYFQETESVTIEMTMVNDLYGITIGATVLIDGSYSKISMLGFDEYAIERNQKEYSLVNMYEKYVPLYIESEDLGIDLGELLDPEAGLLEENFEVIDGYYVYQESLDDLSDYKFKIEEDVITEMYFLVDVEGIEMKVTTEITEYGNTNVSLPSNTVDLESYFNEYEQIEDEYTIGYESFVYFQKSNFNFECNKTSNSCSLETSTPFEYSIEDDIIANYDGDAVSMTINDFYSTYDDIELAKEDLEAMIAIYKLIIA